MRGLNVKIPQWGIPGVVDRVVRILNQSEDGLGHTLVHTRHITSVFITILYISFVLIFCHYQSILEFDADEGNNLIKALLVHKGFTLYSQIWSDQPPAFTYILNFFLSLFGWHTGVARLVILFFSGVIVFVVNDVLLQVFESRGNRKVGIVAAATGCLLLAQSTDFVVLSVSVMIGLPSIALMMLAVWMVLQYLQKFRRPWIIAAGALAALSVGIKLFTIYAVPLCLTGLFAGGWLKYRSSGRLAQLQPSLLFLASFTLCVLFIFIPFTGQDIFSPLWQLHHHVSSAKKGYDDGFKMLKRFFENDTLLFTLAALGGIRAVIMRNRIMTFWFISVVLAAVALFDHYPVWYHHLLLLSVPGAILGGYAVGEMLQTPWTQRMPAWLTMSLFFVVATVIGATIHHDVHKEHSAFHISDKRATKQKEILKHIDQYKDKIKYIVTSRQILAFSAEKPVPPDLSVTSIKRFNNKHLSASRIYKDIEEYHAEMVILSHRWKKPVRRALREKLRSEYRRIYRTSYNDTDIWVLKTLTASAASTER